MKRIISYLYFFPVFFLISLPVFSEPQDKNLQQSVGLMAMLYLSKGEVENYQKKIRSMEKRELKRTLKYINENGDNFLHLIVRLEGFEELNEIYNLDALLIQETEFIFESVGATEFIRLLKRKNNRGLSPLEEAVSSKLSQNSKHRETLSKHLSKKAMTFFYGEESPLPVKNRGLAYNALKYAVHSWNWNAQAVFKSVLYGFPFGGMGVGLLAVGESATHTTLGGVLLAAGATLCAHSFKKSYEGKKAKRILSEY